MWAYLAAKATKRQGNPRAARMGNAWHPAFSVPPASQTPNPIPTRSQTDPKQTQPKQSGGARSALPKLLTATPAGPPDASPPGAARAAPPAELTRSKRPGNAFLCPAA